MNAVARCFLYFGVLVIPLVLNVGGSSANGSDQIYAYKTGMMPRSAAGCQDDAQAIGQRLAAAAGVNIFSTACTYETASGYTVDVKYAAPRPLKFTNAIFALLPGQGFPQEGGLPDVPPYYGAYATQSECFADLPHRLAEYHEQTGLTPIAGYCFNTAFISSYTLQIDAFGVGKKKLQRLELELAGSPDEHLASAVAALITPDEGVITYVATLGRWLSIPYYATVRIPLIAEQIGAFSSVQTAAQCDYEIEQANQALAVLGHSAALSSCTYDPSENVYGVNFIFKGTPTLWRIPQYSGPTFPDYDSCAANRQATLDYYRNVLHRNPAGAVCLMSDSLLGSTHVLTLLGT